MSLNQIIIDCYRGMKKIKPNYCGIQISKTASIVLYLMISTFLLTSCDLDGNNSGWVGDEPLSISQYIEKNKKEYSKFYSLLDKSKMLNTLYAYNPYGEDYTLFVPTDEAIDQFISNNNVYHSFEELLADTAFIRKLTRYHTVSKRLHTDEFPDGALYDLTLTGERLVTGFYAEENKQVIKVNNTAPIIDANLEMTNGFIHVISGVLQQPVLTGYDWLQQQNGYSILAQAIKLSGVKSRLYWKKYTLLAEHDSIYRRNGINNVNDLINRISTPGMSISDKNNTFYLFAAYHFFNGIYYLNDFDWGLEHYNTLANKYLPINVGAEIKINQGIDNYGYSISNKGDTTIIDYIRPFWGHSNKLTTTGPVHSISEILFYEPLP